MALDVRLPPVSFQVFGASGDDHSPGLVPDPGATAGTTRFIREDGQWATVVQSLGIFTASQSGLVPASGGGTVNFLRADATFAPPPTSPAPTPAIKTFINITDPLYGGVGDGVTDNTAALSTAIAFMLTLPSGGCLYFPAGKYHFASVQTITFPASNAWFDCTIIGDGQDASILHWATGNGLQILYNAATSNTRQSFHCRDISFQTAAKNVGVGLALLQNGTQSGSAAALNELTRVSFSGDDSPDGLNYWSTDLTLFGISNVNIDGCGFFGPATIGGGGITFAGQSATDIAVVLNMTGTTINFKNIGFQHGDFIQGTTITGGCNITGCNVGVSVAAGLSGTDAQLIISDSQIGTFANGGAGIVLASPVNVLLIDNMTFVLGNGNSTASNQVAIDLGHTSNFAITNSIFQTTNHSPVPSQPNQAIVVANSSSGSVGYIDGNTYGNFDIAEDFASTASNIRLGQRNFINCTQNTVNAGTNNNAVFLGATPSGQFQMQVQNAAGISGAHGVVIASGANATSDSGTVVASFTTGNNANIVGSITRTAGGGVAYNVTSDERIKRDIVPTAAGLAVLRRLRVVDYTARDDAERERRQGVIAQQIYEHWPQAVRKGGSDAAMEPWLVSLPDFVPLTMRATQELADIIDAQAETIREIRGLNAGLESRIVDLEHAMAEMVDKFAD